MLLFLYYFKILGAGQLGSVIGDLKATDAPVISHDQRHTAEGGLRSLVMGTKSGTAGSWLPRPRDSPYESGQQILGNNCNSSYHFKHLLLFSNII